MWNGKTKAITFSYDDGVSQDIRLIELFDKYGLKCTFNLNSEHFGKDMSIVREGVPISHIRLPKQDIARVYKNHEIAVHTLTHPNLTGLEEKDIIHQVERDRLNLSDIAGYEVFAMAYPGGGVNNDDRVADVIKNHTGVKFARTTTSTYSFDERTNLYRFDPTVYQHGDGIKKTREIAERFFNTDTDKPQLLYIWGHSYELDIHNDWAEMEELLKFISNRDDVFYGTNSQVIL
ncbi:MAG: polysaccharide deacetylase family protein [Clostridia bacterium]|nr:polysaccharide deacetylase family protein [Clostridia bacterium]